MRSLARAAAPILGESFLAAEDFAEDPRSRARSDADSGTEPPILLVDRKRFVVQPYGHASKRASARDEVKGARDEEIGASSSAINWR